MTERDFTLQELKMMLGINVIPDECKDTIRKAIEYMEPTLVHFLGDDIVCDNCGQILGDKNDLGAIDFCFSCGKPIDWDY